MKKMSLFIIKNFEEIICCLALVIMIVVVFINIISGVLFKRRFGECEEIATAAFVWLTYMGVSVAYKNNSHITIDFIVNALPNKAQKVMKQLVNVILIVFNCIVIYYAITYSFHAINQTLPLSGISYFTINISVVLGFIFMTIYCIVTLIRELIRREARK